MRLMMSTLDRFMQGLCANSPSRRRRASRGVLQKAVVEVLEPRTLMTASITNVTSSNSNGTLHAGALVNIQVVFSQAVAISGQPTLQLNSGAIAVGTTLSGNQRTLTLSYTVGYGQVSADLDYISTSALSGTINDTTGGAANLTLAAPGAANSLGSNKSLVIDSTSPFILLTSVTPGFPDGVGNFDTNRTSGVWTFAGTGEAGGTVTLTRVSTGTTTTAVVNSLGNWTASFNSTWSGINTFKATEKDVHGNTGSSFIFTVTVDSTAPIAPFVTAIDSGSTDSTNSFVTANSIISISGQGEAGATVTVANGSNIGTEIVGSTGAWTVNFTGSLSAGANSFTAKQIDPAGNTSSTTNFTVTLNSSATPWNALSTQLANPNGPNLGQVTGWNPGVTVSNVKSGDFNGDGKDDLVGVDTNGKWWVGLSTGTGFLTSRWITAAGSQVWSNILAADFNGDGRADLAGTDTTGTLFVLTSLESSFSTSNSWAAVGAFAGMTVYGTADVDGDHRADVIAKDASNNWTVGRSTGTSLNVQSWGNWSFTPTNVVISDFTGDGRADIAGQDGSGNWIVGPSSGIVFGQQTWGNPRPNWIDVHAADFNGDGIADIVGRTTGSNTWTVLTSGGSGFVSAQSATVSADFTSVIVADMDGNGTADIIGKIGTQNDWHTALTLNGSLAFLDVPWVLAGTTSGYSSLMIANYANATQATLNAFEDIYNTVSFEPYAGAKKGAAATDATHSGNDWDQAALLKSRLPSSVSTRYVYGQIKPTMSDIESWLGVQDAKSTITLLNLSGLAYTDDPLKDASILAGLSGNWLLNPTTATTAPNFLWDDSLIVRNATTSDAWIAYPVAGHQYATVRLFVQNPSDAPLLVADYGNGSTWGVTYTGPISLTSTANGWYYSDVEFPTFGGTYGSYMRFRIQSGGASAQGMQLGQVTFDSRAVDGTPTVPIKHAFLQAYLGSTNGFDWQTLDTTWKFETNSSNSVNALASVPYQPINSNGSLSGSGYFSQTPSNDMSLPADWYQDQLQTYLGLNNMGLSVADVGYHGRIVAKHFTAIPTSYDVPYIYYGAIYSDIPDALKHRVQIKLTRVSDGSILLDQTESTSDIGAATVVIDYTGTMSLVTPQLLINGTIVATGSGSIGKWDQVQLTLDHLNLENTGTSSGDMVVSFVRPAGQVIGIGWSAGQWSDAAFLDQEAQLNQTARGVAAGTVNAQVYQDQMLGLAAMKYFHDVAVQGDQIINLTGYIPVHDRVGSGIMSSPPLMNDELQGMNWTLNGQYPILSNITTDNPNNTLNFASRSGVTDFTTGSDYQLANLVADNDSALEHYVLERFMNREAVSTIKGFELASQHGATFLKILESDTTASSTIASLVGFTSGQINQLISDHNAGYTLYLPNKRVTVPDNSNGTYPTADTTQAYYWIGAIWIKERGASRGYMIMADNDQAAHGGAGGGSVYDSLFTNPIVTPPTYRIFTGDPVDPYNGSFYHDETDFSVQNSGFPLIFSRHYDSLLTVKDSSGAVGTGAIDIGMGLGWTFTYSDYIERLPSPNTDTFIWTTSKGERRQFIFNTDSDTYTSPTGLFGTFSTLTLGGFQYADLNGTIYTFQQGKDIPGQNVSSTFFRLTGLQDRNGNKLALNYDVNTTNRLYLQTIQDITNGTSSAITLASFNWNGAGNHITKIVDLASRTWTYQYDTRANGSQSSGTFLTEINSPSDGGPTALKNTIYDYYNSPQLFGLMSSLQDIVTPATGSSPALYSTYLFNYYSNRRVLSVSDPLGGQQRYTYDLRHNRTMFTDERGNTTVFAFNTNGLTEKVISPDGSRTSNVWDVDHNLLTSSTDALGRVTSYIYNQTLSGIVSSSGVWSNNTTSYGTQLAFDGNLSTYYASSSNSNAFLKVDLGQPTQVTSIQYAPRPTFESRMLNGVFQGSNDNSNWTTLGTITSTPVANQFSAMNIIDTGTYRYIRYFRSSNYADIAEFKLIGNLGQVLTQTDQDGLITNYIYGGSSNFNQINTVVSGSASGATHTTQFAYDSRGNVTRATDSLGQIAVMTYDSRGRLASSTSPQGTISSPGGDYTTRYTYNAAGLVTAESHGATIDTSNLVGRWIFDAVSGSNAADISLNGNNGTLNGSSRFVTGFTGDALSINDTSSNVTISSSVSLNQIGSSNSDFTVSLWFYPTAGNTGTRRSILHKGSADSDRTVSLWMNGTSNQLYYSISTTGAGDNPKVSTASLTLNNWSLITLVKNGSSYQLFINGASDSSLTLGSSVISNTGPLYVGQSFTYAAALGLMDDLRLYSRALSGSEVQSIYKGDGLVVSHTYNAFGSLTATSDGNGNVTNYTTDSLGQVLVIAPPGVGGATIQNTYQNGDLIKTVDLRGNTMTFAYDLNHHMTRQTLQDSSFFGTAYDAAGNISGTTDANGHSTHFLYDDRNRRVITLNSDGSFALNLFDAAGRVVSTVTPRFNITPYGNDSAVTTKVTYDLRDRVNSIVTTYSGDTFSLDGQIVGTDTTIPTTTTYQYDIFGNLTRATDPLGHTTQYQYDALNRQTKTISPDPDGTNSTYTSSTITYAYDAIGNRTLATNALGNITQYQFDPLNRKTREIGADPDGGGPLGSATKTYVYDAASNLISFVDPLSHQTSYSYDALNRRTQEVFADPDGTSSTYTSSTSLYAYDAMSNLTQTTDSLNHITIYSYNALNLRTQVVAADPDGTSSSYTAPTMIYAYDPAGNLITAVDPLNHVTAYGYDTLNRKIRQISAAPAAASAQPVSKYTYDAAGNLLSVTDPLGHATYRFYDMNHRQLYEVNSESTLSYYYDAAGNLTQSVDQLNHVTSYAYDALNRKTSEVGPDPDGTASTYASPTALYAYDAVGNITSVTDPLSHVTSYGYDAIGRRTSEVSADPDGTNSGYTSSTTIYGYDAANNLTNVTDPLGRVTSYNYDALNRKSSEISADPDGTNSIYTASTSLFVYDKAGNLTGVTDPLNHVTTYGYDALNRKISEVSPDPDGTGSTYTSPTMLYAYDKAGNLTMLTDPLNHVTTFGYDTLNRKTSEVAPDPDGTGSSYTSPTTLYAYDAVNNLTSTTDPRGHITTYGYDLLNRMTSEVSPDPDGTSSTYTSPTTFYAYDKVGNMTSVTDSLNHVTTYAYDALNRKTREVMPDPDGTGSSYTSPTTIYAYDAAGNMTLVSDPLAHTTQFQFDALNRKTREILTDPDGTGSTYTSPTTIFAYDKVGNLTQLTDPLNRVTTYGYDALNRQTSEVAPDPDGTGSTYTSPTTLYAYDKANNLTLVIDPLNHLTTYAYDALNRRTSEVAPDPDGTGSTYTSPTTLYAYDKANNLTLVIDPLNHLTTYAYDALNRRTSEVAPDPDGTGSTYTSPTTIFAYDKVGNLTLVIDPLNHLTAYAYDALNRLTKEIDADPDNGGALTSPTTTYAYDNVGNLTQLTDPLNHVTTYGYDALNRQTREVAPDPDGTGSTYTSPTTLYAYDKANNLTQVIDPLNHITTFTYDGLNRLTREVAPDPDGTNSTYTPSTTLYAYDKVGNQTSITNPLSNVTMYEYDGLDRRTRQIDPDPDYSPGILASPTKVWIYDAAGNLLAFVDPNQNTTSYAYDALNRQTRETNQLGDSRTFQYDAAGNMTKKVDRDHRTTTYAYDDLDRQIVENWYDVGNSLVNSISSTYDAAGRLISTGDNFSVTTYDYDDLNRVTAETSVRPDLLTGYYSQISVVVHSQYDAAGNRTLRYLTIDGLYDEFTGFEYDAMNRLVTQRQFSLYDGTAAGLISGFYGSFNGVMAKRIDYTYDAASRKTLEMRYDDLTATDLVARSNYDYDAMDRVTGITHIIDPAGSPITMAYAYAWDSASRLAQQISPDGTNDYTYDADDQLLSESLIGNNFTYDLNGNMIDGDGYGGSKTYRTGADNQMTEDGGYYDYLYDGEGNRTQINYSGTSTVETTWTWDERNRLTDIGSWYNTHFAYDTMNRRISQTVSGTDERYVWDGDDLLAVLDPNGNVLQRFFSGPGQSQAEAEENVGGALYWTLTDNIGSVTDIVDNYAHVQANHIQYSSYGIIQSSMNGTYTRMGYAGYQRDGYSNLYYANARYYDPTRDRFLSQDPSGFGGGDANLYRYVGNHPTYATDPTGLSEGGSSLSVPYGATGVTVNNSYTPALNPISSNSYNLNLGGSLSNNWNGVNSGVQLQDTIKYSGIDLIMPSRPLTDPTVNFWENSGDFTLMMPSAPYANTTWNQVKATHEFDAARMVYEASSSLGTPNTTPLAEWQEKWMQGRTTQRDARLYKELNSNPFDITANFNWINKDDPYERLPENPTQTQLTLASMDSRAQTRTSYLTSMQLVALNNQREWAQHEYELRAGYHPREDMSWWERTLRVAGGTAMVAAGIATLNPLEGLIGADFMISGFTGQQTFLHQGISAGAQYVGVPKDDAEIIANVGEFIAPFAASKMGRIGPILEMENSLYSNASFAARNTFNFEPSIAVSAPRNASLVENEVMALRQMGAMNREAAVLPRSIHQRINLRGAVAAERDLLQSTLSGNKRGPVVGGIMDTTTGRVFTGINTELAGEIHPALQARLAGLNQPFHGEINALNKALWARGVSAQIDESFMLYNLRFGKGGITISPCPTCQGVTQGVFPLSFGVK